MYSFIRKGIFSLDPEDAHNLVIKALGLAAYPPFHFLFQAAL